MGAGGEGGGGRGRRSGNQRRGGAGRTEREDTVTTTGTHTRVTETGRQTWMGAGLQTEKEEKGETENRAVRSGEKWPGDHIRCA